MLEKIPVILVRVSILANKNLQKGKGCDCLLLRYRGIRYRPLGFENFDWWKIVNTCIFKSPRIYVWNLQKIRLRKCVVVNTICKLREQRCFQFWTWGCDLYGKVAGQRWADMDPGGLYKDAIQMPKMFRTPYFMEKVENIFHYRNYAWNVRSF